MISRSGSVAREIGFENSVGSRQTTMPVAPLVPSPRSSHDGGAYFVASLASHDGIAHYFASLALRTACACSAVGPFASLVTRRRRSLLRFSCVANDGCLWHRRPLRFVCHMAASHIAPLLLRHMTASLIVSLVIRRKRRVPVVPSVPSPSLSPEVLRGGLAS